MRATGRALLRPARAVGIALLVLGLALQIAAGEAGMPWRHAWWDLLHRLAPADTPDAGGAAGAPGPAVLVGIDDESTAKLGPWPWPRDVLARLVRRIGELGGAALALGIDLDAPDPLSPPRLAARYRSLGAPEAADGLSDLPDTDVLLLRALEEELPAVLPIAGVPDVAPGARGRGCAFSAPPVRVQGPPLPLGARSDAAIPPIAGLLAGRPDLAGVSLGAVGLRAARGLVLRKVEAVQRICDAPVLMLGIEALRMARGAGPAVIRRTATGLAVFLGDPDDPETLRLPVERDGSFWLRFRRPSGDPGEDGGDEGNGAAARYIPAAALFRPDFDPARIAGRIVVLDLVTQRRADQHRSPLGSLVWSAEAHIGAIEQIVAQDFLRRPWFMSMIETALMLLGSILVVARVPAARPELAVGAIAAGVAAVMAAGYAAFRAGLLVDAAAPAVGITVVAAGTLTATLVERNRARLVSELQLAHERVDRAALQGELGAAAAMQRMLLPAPRFQLPGRIDLAAHLEPAALVGGDFYEHFLLDDDHLFIMVADVSGKGADASQFMVLSKTLLKSVALRTGPDLGAILARANSEILRENAATMFVTGFCGLLDMRTGTLAYGSAGHPAPFLFGGARTPAPIATEPGLPLGILEGARHPVSRCRLGPGDRLCLFSDGITEAMDATGERFGVDRLRAALAEMPPRAGSVGIVTRLLGRISAFTGEAEQSDDLTLMVVSVTLEAPPGEAGVA